MNSCCLNPNVKILDDDFIVRLLLRETKKITISRSINLKLKVCLNCKQYLSLEMIRGSSLRVFNLKYGFIKL